LLAITTQLSADRFARECRHRAAGDGRQLAIELTGN